MYTTRRHCLVALAAALVPGAVRAQEPPKPKPQVDLLGIFKLNYDFRTRAFKAQNLTFRNVVLLGDSITEGFDIEKYFPGRRVLNRGIGGDVIGEGLPADDPRGVLRRMDNSVFDCAASDVFLLIGINDLNSGRRPEQLESGYRKILGQIKQTAPSINVHIQSLLPTRGDFAARNPDVLAVNKTLRALAAEFGDDYIDLHALFSGPDGQLRAELTPDGLHLSDAGYRIWRKKIESVLGWDQ